MQIAIIDDEIDNRNILAYFIEQYNDDYIIIGQAKNVKEAVQLINNKLPDIVFLDIQMPDGTGFDVIKQLNNHTPEIIFCTAYDQFALKAIECSALAYILKPITQEKIFSALAKAQIKIDNNEKLLQYKILQEQVDNKKEKQERFLISNAEGMHIIYFRQLVCCIAHSNYTDIHLESGKRITVSKTLKEIAFIVDEYPEFMRIHQSTIINFNKIKTVIKTEYNLNVVLQNEMSFLVSRSKKDKFLEKIVKIGL